MFCKTTHCALVLMIEAAHVYTSGEGLDIDTLSHKHNIPSQAFDSIVEKLKETKLITIINGKLHLLVSPKEITIWKIVTSIACDNVYMGRYFEEDKPISPSNTMIMIYKEQENILKIIKNRLERQKLSEWSNIASKMIYI